MKFLLLITLFPLSFFCQKKDTIEHNQLSLYFNANNKLYRVINLQNNENFNGWGKFESYDGNEYRYYKDNKLVYVDYRDFENKIIKREIVCNHYDNCLEEHEYYDNNTKMLRRRYFICININNDGEIVEKKCRKYYEYYRNGQVKISGQYQNDKEIGIWIYFDDKGKVSEKINKSN